ncbi:MAG: hypothetical protein WC538_22125 [Thermoanaerobaculia bacterium]|jgi:hypothetical protein
MAGWFDYAMMWALNKYGSGNGSTPNSYPVDLHPEAKKVLDEFWRVYQAGGSPQQQTVAKAGSDFLRQVPSGPSNFQWLSPEMKASGNTFANNIKIPTFDIPELKDFTTAKPPDASGYRPAAPTPSPRGAGPTGSGGTTDARNVPIIDKFDDPSGAMFRPEVIPWSNRRTGYNPADDPDSQWWDDTGTGEPNSGSYDWDGKDRTTLESIRASFDDFRAQHPNWAKYGPEGITAALAATLGLPGLMVGAGLKWILTGGKKRAATQQPPPTGGQPTTGARP